MIFCMSCFGPISLAIWSRLAPSEGLVDWIKIEILLIMLKYFLCNIYFSRGHLGVWVACFYFSELFYFCESLSVFPGLSTKKKNVMFDLMLKYLSCLSHWGAWCNWNKTWSDFPLIRPMLFYQLKLVQQDHQVLSTTIP